MRDLLLKTEKIIHWIGRGFSLYISLIFTAAFLYAMYLLAMDIIGLGPPPSTDSPPAAQELLVPKKQDRLPGP